MNYYFITGTSRGIGKALAEALLHDPSNLVTGFSRSCTITHERYTHITADLSDLQFAMKWKFPVVKDAEKIVLVNNAGTVGAVRYAGRMENDAMVRACNVNLITPSLLTNAFLAAYADSAAEQVVLNVSSGAYADSAAEQVVLNVSSGAGKRAIDGWSVYCATKAGLDLFTETVAAELALSGRTNVHVFSVAPGIVDTAMQDEIRSSSRKDFSRLDDFVEYKSSGQLLSPDLTARKYLTILGLPKKFNEVVFALKDIPPLNIP